MESEHNILNVQLNELRIASYEAEDATKNEHYKLRYRIKLLEKDARDLLKWKSLARSVEQDARESVRYKTALRLAKQREKLLEKELIIRGGGLNDPAIASMTMTQASTPSNGMLNEIWKLRAKRIEREVKELRAWKKQMEENGMNGLYQSNDSISTTSSSTSSLLVPIESSSSSRSSISDRPTANFDALFSASGVNSHADQFAPSLIPQHLSGVVDDSVADELDTRDVFDSSNWNYDDSTIDSHGPVRTTSFDATLLNTHTPLMLPRNNTTYGEDLISHPSPIEVVSGAATVDESSIHDSILQDPDFSHTLPAFLQTE